MNNSLSIAIVAAGLMMGATVTTYAENSSSNPEHSDSDKFQWRPVADDVSVSEYRKTWRHNQRVLRSTMRLYSESAAESMGLPKKARQLEIGRASVGKEGRSRWSPYH